ncbi:DEAD/DEAH box helicase [Deinococcus yavapaiensis]|uniref:AAA domain-containing protein n=1 Tax=Deinococcus yavapaiensis KR-236 TaxID=694435 RepID=A0A318S6Y1_9DEIO|nr:AAA domain-containing protein [Deinococcus yavapaiensis]PYE54071.1 AAA domain-containing protein [Deinococcus yavapaiensis KR-236]
MQANDVQFGAVTLVQLRLLNADVPFAVPRGTEVRLQFNDTLDEVILRAKDAQWLVRGETDVEHARVRALLSQGMPNVLWVARVQGASIAVQAHQFPVGYFMHDAEVIGIDEAIVDDLRAHEQERTSVEYVVQMLAQAVTLPPVEAGRPPRFLLAGTPNKRPDQQQAFRLLGHRWNLDVVRTDDALHVAHVTRSARRNDELKRPVVLVEAPWTFRDETLAGRERGQLQAALAARLQDTRSYLRVWEEYQRLEHERGVERARRMGALPFDERPLFTNGCWRFTLVASPEAFAFMRQQADLTLEASATLPPELSVAASESSSARTRTFIGEYVQCDERRSTVDVRPLRTADLDHAPPERGVLFVSLTGDRLQFERRDRARRAVIAAETPMPQLGPLLEGLDVPRRALPRMEALPPRSPAREVFGGEPTQRQTDAVDVAINTPDIALIQGPPGTGKTRVIAAIQARLAELTADPGRVAAQTLLTSTQHIAVENAASATVVFGLPAVKIGRNRRQVIDAVTSGAERWRQDMVAQVRARLADFPERPLEVRYKRARDLVLRFTGAPNARDSVADVIDEVLTLGEHALRAETKDRLRDLKAVRPSGEPHEDVTLALRAVRALRTEREAFLDDGPASARKALRRLNDAPLTADERTLLEDAGVWSSEEAPPFLEALAHLKQALLTRLQPDTLPGAPVQVPPEVTHALTSALRDLQRALRDDRAGSGQTRSDVAGVLYDFLDALENDPRGVHDAVRDYSAVLAATCQQSDSFAVREFKTKTGHAVRAFDNVVVDEAARVNPLDLLIPMAQAERRIILVGDHRQLPHLLEPDIERQLQASVGDEYQDALHQSLFERLFQDLQARERRDGIKRVVTLDKQYRMHPLLGQFVSDNFYPAGEAFASGRSASDFAHDLPGYDGRPAAWVDVPFERGAERGGRSKSRVAEARWIAAEAKRVLDARPDFSVGVITFYADQVRELLRALQDVDLVEQGEDGQLRIHGAYRETYDRQGRTKERLRVGTVDAFQGMEFDVVFLSVTRSNTLPSSTALEERRKYGHLTLPNRLCVAMSRQQRLLIVVGDTGMLPPPDAPSAVRALSNFHRLCKGRHGRLVSA